MDRRRSQTSSPSNRSTTTTRPSSRRSVASSSRRSSPRSELSRSEYSKHDERIHRDERASRDERVNLNETRRVSHSDLDIFDPIDYVVEDNVYDLREARYRKLHEQRHQDSFDRDWHEQKRLEDEERALRAARESRQAQVRRQSAQREQKERRALAKTPACHWGLLVLTVVLAMFSLPIVFSASTALALDNGFDANYYFLRQLMFVVIGLPMFFFVSRLRRRSLRICVWLMYLAAVGGLLATKFTPLGVNMGNVERWIKLGPLTLQVSEFAKIALIGVMADHWSRMAPLSQRSMWPWLSTGALALPVVGLVFLQPHLSAALVLALIPFAIAFYADVPGRQMVKVVGLSLLLLVTVVGGATAMGKGLKPYQVERVTSFFSPEKDAKGADYQKMQSERALTNGGLFGYGPGNSPSKHGYLPAPHTDFILAVIGEEWGLVGVLILLAAYGAMIFFCFHIGHCASSSFEALLCAGIGTLLALQVVCNAGVVTGTLPVTGMPLPLLSYGGSGLLCALLGIGMVLGVSRELSRKAAEMSQETSAENAETPAASAMATPGAMAAQSLDEEYYESHRVARTSRSAHAGVSA